MMTKLSGGMAALFTAPVFLIVLVRRLRERRAAYRPSPRSPACAPLGLWYPVRNLILFNQPWAISRK